MLGKTGEFGASRRVLGNARVFGKSRRVLGKTGEFGERLTIRILRTGSRLGFGL